MKKISRKDRMRVKANNVVIKLASGCYNYKQFNRAGRQHFNLIRKLELMP